MSIDRLERAVEHIRTAVRGERPYLVGKENALVTTKLNQNESPFTLPADIWQGVLDTWAGIPVNRYPTEQPASLCRAIADYTDWTADGIIAGNGSNELTYLIGMACVEHGVKVILPRPMFSFYGKIVRLYGGEVISVPCRQDLSFDASAIVEGIRRYKPALVVLVTPNNPTGMAMQFAEVKAVAEATEGIVLVDEAYVEFSSQPSASLLLSDYPNVILLRTFSKALGMAGVRLGYLMGHPELMGQLLKARIPFMVDRFSEAVALTMFEHPDLLQERISRMIAGTRHLFEGLSSMPQVDVLSTEANFVTFRPAQDSRRIMEKLLSQGILVRDMSGYKELEGFLRVNTGTSSQNRQFLAALEDLLS